MATVSWYAFVANYISASIAPALPLWNHEFPHDRRPLKDLMGFVAVRFPKLYRLRASLRCANDRNSSTSSCSGLGTSSGFLYLMSLVAG
jgi:hypothetical protein